MKINFIMFSVVFMLMLLTPMAFVNLSGGIVSEQENRMLASRPPMSNMFNHPSDFIRRFDEWFSDNIGFRENLINIHKQIDRMDTPIQYTDGQYIYLIGEQGHRYFAYADGFLISKFQGKDFLTNEQLQGLSNGLSEIKAYLNERNIPFIVMICPDKESIYPEYYPKAIKRGPEPNQLDIITEYLNENSNADVYNIRRRLISEKENYLVFNKTADLTHYNKIGGFFEYLELMKRINVYFPDIKPFTIDDVCITYNENGIPNVLLEQETTYTELDPGFFDNVEVNRPFTTQNRAFKNSDQTLPTILLMRDSYTNFFIEYLSPHFGETIAIHYSNMKHFEEYVDLYKPDIVVFESAERELRGFANAVMSYHHSE